MAEPSGIELPGGIVARYQGEQGLAEPINATMIRLWCEMVEDANPLYHDADFARSRGFKDIVAPPTMLLAWTFEPTWTPEAGRGKEKARDMPDVPGYPNACVLRIAQTYHRPLEPGERPQLRYYRHGPSEETDTPRGRGVLMYNVMSLRDDDGNEIVRQDSVVLRFRSGDAPSAPRGTDTSAKGGSAPGSDAPAGDEEALAPLVFPVPLKRFMIAVAATRDFYEVHHDAEFARATGVDDMYIGTHFTQGLVGRYVTDFAGPGSVLRSLELTPFERNHPGDVMTVEGRVVARYSVGDEARADLTVRVSNSRVLTHEAKATVALADG
jgi:acyl dehydratase